MPLNKVTFCAVSAKLMLAVPFDTALYIASNVASAPETSNSSLCPSLVQRRADVDEMLFATPKLWSKRSPINVELEAISGDNLPLAPRFSKASLVGAKVTIGPEEILKVVLRAVVPTVR